MDVLFALWKDSMGAAIFVRYNEWSPIFRLVLLPNIRCEQSKRRWRRSSLPSPHTHTTFPANHSDTPVSDMLLLFSIIMYTLILNNYYAGTNTTPNIAITISLNYQTCVESQWESLNFDSRVSSWVSSFEYRVSSLEIGSGFSSLGLKIKATGLVLAPFHGVHYPVANQNVIIVLFSGCIGF